MSFGAKVEFKTAYRAMRHGSYISAYFGYDTVRAAQYALYPSRIPALRDRLAAYKADKEQMMREACDQWELAQY